MIYWDHNASSPIHPAALQALHRDYAAGFAHPSSLHQAGRQSLGRWEELLDSLGNVLGCQFHGRDADGVIWTTSGTLANRIGIETIAAKKPGRVLVGATEHPSVGECTNALPSSVSIPVRPNGVIDLTALEHLLREPTSLVIVQWVNHETGVIQPIREISALCRRAETFLHVDAVQAVGKIDCHVHATGVDSLTFAGHKFGGPRGIAAWVCCRQLLDQLAIPRLPAGTPPLELVSGLLAAWKAAADPAEQRRLGALRDALERHLISTYPGTVIHGATAPRVHQTSSLAFPGVDRQALLMALDLAGLCCSAGAACASGSAEPAPTLLAMGIEPSLVGSSIRVSMGHTTTSAELAEGLEIFAGVLPKLLAQTGSGTAR